MKLKQTMLLIFIIILIFLRCDTTEPPNNVAITLNVEDVSCTEAWLKLTTTNLPLPVSVALKQNDITRATINLSTADTLLYIDSLLPKQNYTYQVSGIGNPVSSNALTVTTLDTTSHNFTFQTWTFGEHSSSLLYDVAIINENNIWAVGEIYMKDSLGNPDPTFYNAIHWDGTNWKLEKIFYKGGIWDIRTIFAFNENDIWFSGYMRYLNGQFIELPIPNILMGWQIKKLWGSNSSDLYAVGDGGNIAHYSNGSWTKIESGTTTNINDVWGVVDPITQEQEVFCAVSFVFQQGDQKILNISNNKVDSLSWTTGRRIHSIWAKSNLFIYTSGGGIFENKGGYWKEIVEVPLYYSENIRGTELNDIYVCGDFGLFAHYNGSSWHTYNELYMQGIYFSLSPQNNIVVSVGLKGSKAIVVKGLRN
jgi:hypothetical protein